MNKCKCTPDETTGWTEIKCCNVCGKPVQDFWGFPELIDNETLSSTVYLMRSVINKLINVENPTYTEAELLIIKDSTDRYNKEILCEYCGYLKPDHEERCIKKVESQTQ